MAELSSFDRDHMACIFYYLQKKFADLSPEWFSDLPVSHDQLVIKLRTRTQISGYLVFLFFFSEMLIALLPILELCFDSLLEHIVIS